MHEKRYITENTYIEYDINTQSQINRATLHVIYEGKINSVLNDRRLQGILASLIENEKNGIVDASAEDICVDAWPSDCVFSETYDFERNLEEHIKKIKTEFRKLIGYENTQKLIPRKKKGFSYQIILPSHDIPLSTSSINTSSENINFGNYFAVPLEPMDIAKQLIANDTELYGPNATGVFSAVTSEIEGNPSTWCNQITAHPEHWYFAFTQHKNETKIVGNYSFCGIDPHTEEIILNNSYNASLFTVDKTTSLGIDCEAIVLLNLSMNLEYHFKEHFEVLFRHLFEQLAEATHVGCYIKRIYALIFRFDQVNPLDKLGFKEIQGGHSAGKLMMLDLTKPFNKTLQYLAPQLHKTHTILDEHTICCRKLTDAESQDEQILQTLARYTWNTDKYIYKPMIPNTKDAERVLPFIYRSNEDPMWNLQNYYCCFYNNELVGIILYTQNLKWDSTLLKQAMLIAGIEGDNHLIDQVEKEYFSKYSIPDTLCITNFYVDPLFRKKGIESILMNAFVSDHPDECMMLYCLQETTQELSVYLNAGFSLRTAEKCNGFSTDNQILPCFRLFRNPKS